MWKLIPFDGHRTGRHREHLLYDFEGDLRPPAGCARLASLAVLAGQHQSANSRGRVSPATARRTPTSTAGTEGGAVAGRATGSYSRSPRRRRPERTTVTGVVSSSRAAANVQ